MVVDFEFSGGLDVVHNRQTTQVVKVQSRIGPANVADVDDAVGRDRIRHLIDSGSDLHSGVGFEYLLQRS